MNIKINSVHFDADKKLLDFVESKLNKIENIESNVVSAEVFLTYNKGQADKENKSVKIKIDIPGNELFAEKESKTFEEATDLVIDALKKQIKKYKEKQRD